MLLKSRSFWRGAARGARWVFVLCGVALSVLAYAFASQEEFKASSNAYGLCVAVFIGSDFFRQGSELLETGD